MLAVHASPPPETVDRSTVVVDCGHAPGELTFRVTECDDAPRTDYARAGSSALPTLTDVTQDALRELDSYLRLAPGWDGYSGLAFRQSVVEGARRFVDTAHQVLAGKDIVPAEITPGPASDGRVDIEIAVESRRLIVTFGDGEDVGLYCEDKGARVLEETCRADDGRSLEEGLHWLIGARDMPLVLGATDVDP